MVEQETILWYTKLLAENAFSHYRHKVKVTRRL